MLGDHDDAPEEAEVVVEAFNKVLAEWHFPCPYWFEDLVAISRYIEPPIYIFMGGRI